MEGNIMTRHDILFVFLLIVLLLPGCAFYTSELTVPVPGVAQTLEGSSCAPFLLGLGMGSLSLTEAMATAHALPEHGSDNVGPKRPITRLSVVSTEDASILIFGWRCINAKGDDATS